MYCSYINLSTEFFCSVDITQFKVSKRNPIITSAKYLEILYYAYSLRWIIGNNLSSISEKMRVCAEYLKHNV